MPKPKPIPVQTPTPAPIAAPAASPQPVYTAPPVTQSDSWYEQQIFAREGALASMNAGGCIGLGQSCPAVRGDSDHAPLALACPNWRTDEPCQLVFWQGYMADRYHTWAAAYSFRIANGWW